MTTSSQLQPGGLQPKDRQLLRLIDRYINENGYSPTLRELRELSGMSSLSVVSSSLRRLEKAAAITRRYDRSRTIVVLDGGLGEE